MRSCRLLARPGPAKNRRHRASDQTKVQAEAPPGQVCVAEREVARQELPDIEVLRDRTPPQEELLVPEGHPGEIRDSRPHGQELDAPLEGVVGRSHATANVRRRPSAAVSRTAAITWSTAAFFFKQKTAYEMRRGHSRNATGKSSAR